jgi:hypothetical protein
MLVNEHLTSVLPHPIDFHELTKLFTLVHLALCYGHNLNLRLGSPLGQSERQRVCFTATPGEPLGPIPKFQVRGNCQLFFLILDVAGASSALVLYLMARSSFSGKL